MNHSEKVIDLKCLRALDNILLGIFLLIPIAVFYGWISTISFVLFKYIYIVPMIIICHATFAIPKDIHKNNEWVMVLKRLRFFSAGVVALSPFWGWCHTVTGNIYIFTNVIFLILFSMLYIYNFVTLVVISAKEHGWLGFMLFAKLTRLTIIYIIIAPLVAFIFTTWYMKNSLWSIIIFFIEYQNLILPFILIPLLMANFILIQWRRKMELNLHQA